MKSGTEEFPKGIPTPVAEGPQPVGDIGSRGEWVEPTVWTERMLTRLENEPKANWFRLWDKVFAVGNLRAAYAGVRRNHGSAGVDGQTVAQFGAREEAELAGLSAELREGKYRPQPSRRVWIPKPGTTEERPLGIPAVRDRVVQGALRKVLEPIFERNFAEASYGFRPGRGCREAVAQVEQLLSHGAVWCVDADLKSYFDTIPHLRLMERIRERVADGSVLRLIEAYLKVGVMETMREWQATEAGTPQGAVVSPLLANLYLDSLDHAVTERGWAMVRYADDLVILCARREEAEAALTFLRQWVTEAGLILHPTKTQIVNAEQTGFDFLGWHFRRGQKWPRKKSVQKLRQRLRPLTRRTVGQSLNQLVTQINPILRGWHQYFRDSLPSGLEDQDRWLRRRLRALLRKWEKRPAFGRSQEDHRRWPNRWFATQGLFSLRNGSCVYG